MYRFSVFRSFESWFSSVPERHNSECAERHKTAATSQKAHIKLNCQSKLRLRWSVNTCKCNEPTMLEKGRYGDFDECKVSRVALTLIFEILHKS